MTMEIKNINDIKNYNIVCTNIDEVMECKIILNELGWNTGKFEDIKSKIIVRFSYFNNFYTNYSSCDDCLKNISFYDFKKQSKNLIPVVQDIEYNKEDGRVVKINNWSSDKFIYDLKYPAKIENCNKESLDLFINLGLIFISEEKRDKAKQKLIIETKLRNIADRLNNGVKIDWNIFKQYKHYIQYYVDKNQLNYDSCRYCKEQGTIYCLSNKFLDEAIKNIGEQELINYFKE